MHTSGLDYRRWRGVFRSRIKESLLGLLNREDASIESKGPVFTFTFDDAPSSAYSTGANILENAGCNGTFFLCGKYIETATSSFVSAVQAVDLLERGHTIGAHTYSHMDAHKVSSSEFCADALAGAAAVATQLGRHQAMCFSYPFGSITRQVKSFSGKNFFASRGSFPGINTARVDRSMIRGNRLYSSLFCHRWIERLIQKTVEHKAWTVFYTHDVSPDPSRYGITPDQLRATIDLCKSMGGRIAVFPEPLTRE